jgi:uncharacterized protein
MNEVPSKTNRPWWREPMMYLVVGGPLAVIVASFVTLGLALRYPDPPVQTRQVVADEAGQQPAVTARNHAATGGKR